MYNLFTELYALPAYSESVEMASFIRGGESLSVGGIIGCVVAAFVAGMCQRYVKVNYY